MDVALFDYELPPELIAQQPADRRPNSRMLLLPRAEGAPCDGIFAHLPEHLRRGDCLVLNDTRVIPARLIGRRPTGGQAEVLLLRELEPGRWRALVRPGARMRPGAGAVFGDGELTVEIEQMGAGGERTIRLRHEGALEAVLDRLGRMPLPPYIRRPQPEEADRERYQTVYARRAGAAAAPTAGLHFDEAMLARVQDKGVEVVFVTLHVGLGTFQPVSVERVEEHEMHEEWCEIGPEVAAAIGRCRAVGGRVIAVGTTSVRTLESRAVDGGTVVPGAGMTKLFITPGYQFRVVDGLLTNFHLPRSTLLMMVSAFAGRERVLAAYAHAAAHGYRFYSYGDCMLIV